jgi:hypothetical protein
MAVAGVLDVPGRRFSIDASIYDSYVGSFSIGGDMAFRLAFGGTPNFALAVGGFNPSYKAPPSFPELRRVTIDLGVNGNPSLTAYGYFALTPNTAQLGAGIDLRASGAGIRLEGHAGFDAIFIFSPFSFTATMDAGMSVKFHGVGLGVHFHGELSGPTPWHINGRVCVSVLFWDACLGVDITFGESRRAELPAMDPWFGPDSPPAGAPTLSLKAAIEDAHNWSASATAGGETVVTLRQRASDAPALVDPMGAAALRQKVVPLGQKITKFGEFKPSGHDEFKVASVTIAGEEQTREPILDDFVPSHFKAMSNAERLSSKPYDQMQAGFSLGPPHMAAVGAIGEKEVVYETQLLDGNRQRVQPQPPDYPLTRRHLLAMLARSATALEGVRRAGIGRYVDPTAPTKVRLGPELYVVATSCSLVPNLTLTGGSAVSRTAATLSIEFDVSINPGNAGGWAAVPAYEVPR